MAKLLKLRRGTTSQHSSFTGAEGEVTVDTDKDTLVVHDNSTAGGHPVAAEDMANVSSASIVGRLGTGSILKAKLEADIIDGTKLADDAVDSEHIAAGAVDLEHMSSESVDEDNLHISNAGTNGQFLQKQSGNTGGLTWADATTSTIPVTNSTANTGHFIVFADSNGGNVNARVDSSFAYNPSTDLLTIPNLTTSVGGTITCIGDATIKGANGGHGLLNLWADRGDDNSDKWKLEVNSSDNYFRIYDYGQGSWIERLKIDAAGKLYATTFQGIGTDLTSLNASNLGSGTVASARVSGAYTGITGVGTLTSLNTSGTFTEDENHLANNTPVINCSLGNYFTIDISSNCTFSFTNEPANTVAYGCVVEVVHSGGTISWPSELKWSTDAPPSLTTGKTHLFFFTTNDGGARWRGAYQVDYTN